MGLSSDGIRERVLAHAGRIFGPGLYELRQLGGEVVLLRGDEVLYQAHSITGDHLAALERHLAKRAAGVS